jgi:N-acetylglucosaminyldiphosphoundecaprenol N-acetyl-beta-D-mannosaminyltransferase
MCLGHLLRPSSRRAFAIGVLSLRVVHCAGSKRFVQVDCAPAVTLFSAAERRKGSWKGHSRIRFDPMTTDPNHHSSPARGEAHRTILGVRFFCGTSEEAAIFGLRGGLVVVPAAPALAEIGWDKDYREAARQADLVLTDSGFMVLVWQLLTGERLPRTSGLRYLRLLLTSTELQQGAKTLWIMPTLASARRCVHWLRSVGVPATLNDCYIAPCYPAGPVNDPDLLAFVRERRPAQIFLGLGGGTQEKVGLFLKRHLDYRPGIHCIGAAIGFLTGDQVHIPDWADRWMLGWLLRCLDHPGRFVPRYWRSSRLAWMIWKYRSLSPMG